MTCLIHRNLEAEVDPNQVLGNVALHNFFFLLSLPEFQQLMCFPEFVTAYVLY